MPDQIAKRIISELIGMCSRMGLPSVVHSDQRKNFKSTNLKQTLDSFGGIKSHTTAYHPQGDGMVEWLNWSLLQMLRSYVEQEADWECYLPLAIFVYCTTCSFIH